MSNYYENAQKAQSFIHWLKETPEEDLRHLSDVCEEVANDKLSDENVDTWEQIVPMVMIFSGKVEMHEDELIPALQLFTVVLGCEINVREGKMTVEGEPSLIPGKDTARYKMTPYGEESVRKMIKGMDLGNGTT